jgi:thiol-disulfide isomerase/thioredoxin
MKIFAASLLLAFTGIVAAAAPPESTPGLPRKAAEFVFNMQDGKQLLLSSFRGKTIAMAFMFTTCPHCQALCPILANIQKDYAAKGVQFVGAVVDDGAKDGLANFNSTYVKGAFPVGWSPQPTALEFLKNPINKMFYAPSMAFIDKKGMIVSQYIGDNDFYRPGDQEKNIRAELDKVLAGTAGKPAAKPSAPKSFTKTITAPTKP